MPFMDKDLEALSRRIIDRAVGKQMGGGDTLMNRLQTAIFKRKRPPEAGKVPKEWP